MKRLVSLLLATALVIVGLMGSWSVLSLLCLLMALFILILEFSRD